MTFRRIGRFLIYLTLGLPLLGAGMLAAALGVAVLIHELKDPGSDPGGFTLTVILIFLTGRLAWTLSAKPQPRSRDEMAANARIIAASPDLLEALLDLVQINEKHNESISKIIGRPLGWKDTYLDKARAAIAKATGKEEA